MSTERCQTCGRTFKTRLGLGVHQSRNRACRDPEARRRRAREREARYRARHPDRRRRQVAEARLRLLLRQPDYFRTWRLAHAVSERARRQRWKLANPGLLRAQRRRRAARRRPEFMPIPPSHARHPLFERAWEILHGLGIKRDDHLATIHDPRWEDACSEVVLALLEGRNAELAARATMSEARRHSARNVRLDDLEGLLTAG